MGAAMMLAAYGAPENLGWLALGIVAAAVIVFAAGGVTGALWATRRRRRAVWARRPDPDVSGLTQRAQGGPQSARSGPSSPPERAGPGRHARPR